MKMNIPLDRGTDDDHALSSQIPGTGDSPVGPVEATSRRWQFPLGTLMVCFTIWLIVTEILIFDQIKFNAKAELLEEAAQVLHRPELIVPTQRLPNLPSRGRTEKL